MTQEKQNAINQAACDAMAFCEDRPGTHAHRYNYYCNTMEYDNTTAICTMTRNHWHRGCFGGACDWDHDIKDQKITWQLPKVDRNDMRGSNGGSVKDAVKNLDTIQSDVFNGKTYEDYK